MTAGEPDRALRGFLEDGIRAGKFPGAAWWVGGPGGVRSAGTAGWAALEPRREPAVPGTVYDLASLTKPLATALLAALLEADGRVDLDAPCAAVLRELRATPCGDASALELGAHRAGLPSWAPVYLTAQDRESYLAAIARLEPAAPRGRTLYSDLGYIALGILVERTGGAPLDRLFRERVAGPLGLRSTGFAVPPGRFASAAPTERGNHHERRMAGRAGRDHRWRTELLRGEVHDGNADRLGGVAGHAGLFGTAEEVSAIAREMLRPRRLRLGGRAREILLAPAAAGSDRTFGMVLARGSGAARGALPDDAPGHVGFTGTSLWVVPASGDTYVLLTNRVHPVVSSEDFQPVRNRFHRLASRIGS